MNSTVDRYERLLEARHRLMSAPQSATREYEIALLEFDITQLESKLRLRAVETADMLFKAWLKSGGMRVMLPNGKVAEAQPVLNVSSVESIWAGKREACYLAALSLGVPHLKVLGGF